MQNKKRRIALSLSLLFVLSMFGCGKTVVPEGQTVLYKFGKSTVTYGEFYIYAETIKEDYQKNYGNGIWSLELSTDEGASSVKEITVQDLLDDINRVKVLVKQAEELEIVLSDEEMQEAQQKAKAFCDGLTKTDKSESEVTQEIATQVISENMLAAKVYDSVIKEKEFEVSEEEARMTTFYDMVFECYKVDQDGSVEEYTDEKKALQLERANEALSSLAQEEKITYDDIVNKYNLEYSSSRTMSKNEMVNEYGETIANKLLSLQDGEVSVVIESKYGYHIFKMILTNDEELTKQNKLKLVEEKQHEYFNNVYEEWKNKYDSKFNSEVDVNKDVISRFKFD